MILLNNLSVSRNKKDILKNLNYSFEEGKIYGLLGPNGSGKSTLFKTMINVIDYNGEIVTSNIKNIGHLIEYPAFYRNLSCYENLNLHANYKMIESTNISSYLKLVNLKDAENEKFKNLSLGMKQRLGIAKSLMGNSELILLDEPSNGLDPSGIIDIRNIINNIRSSNRTIIVSSHILNEINHYVDIILFIHDGQFIAHVKNDNDKYGIIYYKKEIEEQMDMIQNNLYTLIKCEDGSRFIVGDYNNLAKFTDMNSITEINLEALYLKLMSMNIVEVIFK